MYSVDEIWRAVKTSREPAYLIAQKAGLDETVLSKIINGHFRIRPEDPRLAAIARVLGISG